MKKLTLVVLALLLALPLFAGELDNAVFKISGDAKTIFGIDLMSMATGFENKLTAKLQLDFGPESDNIVKNGSEEGAIYGEIKFDEINVFTREINNTDDNDADLEMDIDLEYAKIIGPNWWVSVKGPDDSIDYENGVQNGIFGLADPMEADRWDGQPDNLVVDNGGNAGIDAGIMIPDIAEIGLGVFSLTDYKATGDDKNGYGVEVSLSLKAVENLTFDLSAVMGFNTGAAAGATDTRDDIGFGALLKYAIKVNDDITITPEIGADIAMRDDDTMAMAIGNGLKITLPGSEITKTEDFFGKDDDDDNAANWGWDDGVNSGINVGWCYYMPSGTGAVAQLGLQAHVGLSMIEGLEVAIGFESADLMNNGDMAIGALLRYTAGSFVPYAGVFNYMDNDDVLTTGATGWSESVAGDDNIMIAQAGFALNNIVPLTNIMLDWASGDLTAEAGQEADLGIVRATVQVKY